MPKLDIVKVPIMEVRESNGGEREREREREIERERKKESERRRKMLMTEAICCTIRYVGAI